MHASLRRARACAQHSRLSLEYEQAHNECASGELASTLTSDLSIDGVIG